MRDPTHQLSVHVLHVCCVLLISELHPLCTVRTTIAPRVLHFSAVHYVYYSALQDTYTEVHVGWTDNTLSLYFFVLALIAVAIHTDEL